MHNDIYIHEGYLPGQLLVATPAMEDTRFSKAVILLCGHNEEGAMGFIINRLQHQIKFEMIAKQLKIATHDSFPNIDIHLGGPLDVGRGFVVHSKGYEKKSTTHITENISLTTELDIIKDIALGVGPEQSLLTLGYSGWKKGQLENEIKENAWNICPFDIDLVFETNTDSIWDQAMANIGLSSLDIADSIGHA